MKNQKKRDRQSVARAAHQDLNDKFWPRRKDGNRLGLRRRALIRAQALATIDERLDGMSDASVVWGMRADLKELLAAGLTKGYDPNYRI